MAHRLLRLAARLGVVALLFSACAGAETSTAPPAPRSSTTTGDATAVEQEVLEAYLGFWDAVFAAHSPPNPDHPDLARYAAGGQLERAREVAAQDLSDGIGVRRGDPPNRHDPRVVDVVSNAAVVVDCWLDTDVLYDLESDAVVDGRQVWTFGRFRLVRVEGEWKVDRSDMEELAEEGSCDALVRESS